MVKFNLTVAIIIINVNGLNISIENSQFSRLNYRSGYNSMLSMEMHLNYKDMDRLKAKKKKKKIYPVILCRKTLEQLY